MASAHRALHASAAAMLSPDGPLYVGPSNAARPLTASTPARAAHGLRRCAALSRVIARGAVAGAATGWERWKAEYDMLGPPAPGGVILVALLPLVPVAGAVAGILQGLDERSADPHAR